MENLTMLDLTILNEAKNRLINQFHPERIILFGSQARGTADARSDIDLLVIGTYQEDPLKIMSSMDRALAGLDFPCDSVVMSPQEFEIDREIPGTIARPAWKEGKIIYEQ